MANAAAGGLASAPAAFDVHVEGRTARSLVWRRFRADRGALFGLWIVLVLIALAILAPACAAIIGHGPNDLYRSMLTAEFGLPKGPTAGFWFGTDQAGRDVLVRCIYGLRTSLIVSVLGTSGAVVIGVAVGMIAGYFGRWTDIAVSRFIDIMLSMPLFLFAIGLGTICSSTAKGCLGGTLKPGVSLVTGVIALFSWPYIARVMRNEVLVLKGLPFVEAAETVGCSHARILMREILPNLVGPIIVLATLLIPFNVIFEASLSYLGVGVSQSTPSLGRMIAEATNGDLYTQAWWLAVFPGLFLLATTLAFNLLGDGLRDALNPRGNR